MKTKLLHVWDVLTSSYWFVPTLMLIGAFIAALVLLWVDRTTAAPGSASALAYTGGPDGARSLLSAVASTVITVAGVVFSITISTLTQASSQFGPRLLRRFMRDTGNQIVLGTFVATFLYCLLVLRAVRGGDDGHAFVPNYSVTGAVVLAVASIAVLIYFIDHVSRSLQGPILVATIGQGLAEEIEKAYPRQMGDADPAQPAPQKPERTTAVRADDSGYLQAIDQDGLLAAAADHDLFLRLRHRPGDFVTVGQPLLTVDADHVDEHVANALRSAFLIGQQRTEEQDVEYAFRQLVEVAVRALSPGINDPFTAVNCIDWLGVGLTHAARAGTPASVRHDAAGRPRLTARLSDFPGLADVAFNQIRQYGKSSVAVATRLLEKLAVVAHAATTAEQVASLRRHVEQAYADSRSAIDDPADQADVTDRYRSAVAAVDAAAERMGG